MARKITEISPLRTFLGGFLISVHSITAVSLAIMITERSKEVRLMKQKYYLALTTEEWRLMIEPLNNLRDRLVSEGDTPTPWIRCLSRAANQDMGAAAQYQQDHQKMDGEISNGGRYITCRRMRFIGTGRSLSRRSLSRTRFSKALFQRPDPYGAFRTGAS